MCNEHGGTVDDLIVYKKSDEHYFIVVNAANKDKDYQWMLRHQFGKVTFKDVSSEYAQLALQGPKAMEILKKLTAEENIPKKYYHAVFDAEVAGIPCIVSKTGYTGEDGVELYLASEKAEEMWDALLEAGKEEGLVPCGLGARDTLRMEAAMPLYGHEMNDDITPLETGLKFAVKMAKNDFIGKSALEEKGTPPIKRIGLKVTGRGIIREHQDVYAGDRKIGHTTSGTHCPYLGYPIAMALVDADSVEIGDAVEKARLFRRGKHGLQRGQVYAVVLHRHAGQARAAAAERVERPQERRVFHSHHVALVAKAFGREIQDLLAAGCNEHAVVFLRHPFAPVGKGPHGFAHRGHALRHRILQRGHRVLPQQFVRKARDVLRRE